MGRLHSVQFLRFIAASLVVLVHYILAVKDCSAVYNTPLTVVNGFL